MKDYPDLQKIAEIVNHRHIVLMDKARNMVAEAIEIGRFLAQAKAQICHHDKFVKWLAGNVRFSQKAAYRYLGLYKFQSQITGARSLTEAYQLIENLGSQRKQIETEKAFDRIKEYRETGRKPKGWRRGTDDKLAREEAEHSRQEANRNYADAEQKIYKQEEELECINTELNKLRQEEAKRISFRNRIELSDEEKNNQYYAIILDYLAGLSNDTRQIEACNYFIKICKKVSIQLQAQTEKG